MITRCTVVAALMTVVSFIGIVQVSARSGAQPPRPGAVSEQVKEISVDELKPWLSDGSELTLIDVRDDAAWQAGHAVGAKHIATEKLPATIGAAVPVRSARIVLYCQGGVRSVAAAMVLQKIGYTNVFSLAGGFTAYERAGLPIER